MSKARSHHKYLTMMEIWWTRSRKLYKNPMRQFSRTDTLPKKWNSNAQTGIYQNWWTLASSIFWIMSQTLSPRAAILANLSHKTQTLLQKCLSLKSLFLKGWSWLQISSQILLQIIWIQSATKKRCSGMKFTKNSLRNSFKISAYLNQSAKLILKIQK